MTIEEIREGIRTVIEVNIAKYQDCETDQLRDYLIDWMTDKIRHNLHSQGVVIKKEGELPECPQCHGVGEHAYAGTSVDIYIGKCITCNGTGKDYSGYTLTEPLIKEEK